MLKFILMIVLLSSGVLGVVVGLDVLQGTAAREVVMDKKIFFLMTTVEDYLMLMIFFLPLIIGMISRRNRSSS